MSDCLHGRGEYRQDSLGKYWRCFDCHEDFDFPTAGLNLLALSEAVER